MPWVLSLAVGGLLALAPPARAQVEVTACPTRFAEWQFAAFLDEVDRQFASLALGLADHLLVAGGDSLLCLDRPVPPRMLARYAIGRAFAAALRADAGEASRWASLAFTLDRGIDWPAYVPPYHVVRTLPIPRDVAPVELVDVVIVGVVAGDGARLDPHLQTRLDGRTMVRVAAEPDMPHLLQGVGRSGEVTWSRWIDGVAFPEEILARSLGGPAPDEAASVGGIDLDAAPPPAEPGGWSPRRTRRLVTGLSLGIASGTLFTTAHVARAAYDRRLAAGVSTRELTPLFYMVDGAVVASAATAGLGAVYVGLAIVP